MQENKLAGFGTLFKGTLKDFGQRFGLIAAFSALTFAIGVVFPLLLSIGVVLGIKNLALGIIISFVVGLAFLFSAWLINGAFMYSMKDGASFKESFKFIWKNFKPYVWVAILPFFAIFPGLVALIIPGLVLAMFLMFSTFVFMDDGTKGIAALNKSKDYVKPRFWAIIGRSVLFVLVVAAANIVISVIGQPILQPLFSAFVVAPASLCFYWRLFKDVKAKKTETEKDNKGNFVKVLSIIGAVLFATLIIFGFVIVFTNLPAFKQAIQEAGMELTNPSVELGDSEETGLTEDQAAELQKLFEEIQNSQ